MFGAQKQSLLKFLFMLAVLVTVPFTASSQAITLIDATNTVWAYNDATTTGTSLHGTGWELPGYDTNSAPGWKAGKPLFGNDGAGIYDTAAHPFRGGINGFITPLNRTGGRVTFYFRTTFNWSGSTVGVSLTASNWVDDGIIVYLNGVEASRLRVPAGAVTWDTLGANPATEGAVDVLQWDASALVDGLNTVAVELHQSGAGSSDAAFSIALVARPPSAPILLDPTQPTNRVVQANRSTTLSALASGTPDPAYQWFKDGSPILDATNANYVILQMMESDQGSYFAQVTNILGSVTTRTAIVTYTSDSNAPTVVRAFANATFTELRVEFSEVVETTGGQDGFNYTISGGIEVSGDGVLTNGRTVILALSSPLSPDTDYTVKVNNVTDLAGNPILTDTIVPFHSWVLTSAGGWVFESFNGTTGPNNAGTIAGTAIINLTGDATYPNKPSEVLLMPGTSTRLLLAGYETDSHENYGARIRGLFFPPHSGNWIFYMSSDDAGQLFLNPTGPNAAGKMLIAQQNGCCNLFNAPGAWTSAPIPLVGGQPYYIEGLYKEGGGGDYFHVAVAPEGEPIPVGGGANNCPSCNDSSQVGFGAMPAGAAGTFAITRQPTNVASVAAMPVTFSVGVTQQYGLPVLYQWLRDGSPIAGENRSSYTFIPSLADNAATFRVAVTNLGGAGVISDSATLTVSADTVLPTVISTTPSLDGSNIVVRFSEAMHADTSDISHYQVNGIAPASATLSADAKSVTVGFQTSLATPCAANTLQIGGTRDIAGNSLNPDPTIITFTTPFLAVPIDATQIWRWESSGADLTASGWQNSGYDDSSWPFGPGVLAFEPNDNTPLGFPIRTQIPDYLVSKLTIYFRTHFNLGTDPRTVTSLQLSEIIDDGSVVYLNGREVHRLRVSPGPLTYATGANAGGVEPHPLEGPFELPTSALVYGDNVLAIAVLQSGAASSDIVMGAQLLVSVSSCAPPLTITPTGLTATLTWPDPTFALESAPTVTGPWTPLAGASGLTVSTATGNRFFRLVK